jgi:hypothetical protein
MFYLSSDCTYGDDACDDGQAQQDFRFGGVNHMYETEGHQFDPTKNYEPAYN